MMGGVSDNASPSIATWQALWERVQPRPARADSLRLSRLKPLPQRLRPVVVLASRLAATRIGIAPMGIEAGSNAAGAAGREGAAVEVERVTRRFGEHVALNDVSLTIREGEFFSMLGPSGCGKTTLLRLIAGLDLPDGGTIRIGGADVGEVPAHLRPVNTVFQSYALFPHLNVRDNVAFGLRMKKVPEAEVGPRVDAALEMVQITAFATRKPQQLSGGQKQRVALARALINRPKVLLLDEPLGALDLKLRKELQVELLALQRRVGITFVFVTHDQEEALVLSDRIAVMRAGVIEQVGEASQLYEHPRTRFVGQFLGTCNLVEGSVSECTGGRLVVDTPIGRLAAADGGRRATGAKVALAIRPEKVQVLAAAGGGPNEFSATLDEVIYSGSSSEYRLAAACGLRFTAQLLNAQSAGRTTANGETIALRLPPENLIVLEE
jgi:spermidine/putrescine transport system ATP-binding protein